MNPLPIQNEPFTVYTDELPTMPTVAGTVAGDEFFETTAYPTFNYTRKQLVRLLKTEIPYSFMPVGLSLLKVYWIGERTIFYKKLMSYMNIYESTEESKEIESEIFEIPRTNFLHCRFWSEYEIRMFLSRTDTPSDYLQSDVPVDEDSLFEQWNYFHDKFARTNEDICAIELGERVSEEEEFTIEELVSNYISWKGSFYDLFKKTEDVEEEDDEMIIV